MTVTVVVVRNTDSDAETFDEEITTYVFAGDIPVALAVARARQMLINEDQDQDREEAGAMVDEFYEYAVKTSEAL